MNRTSDALGLLGTAAIARAPGLASSDPLRLLALAAVEATTQTHFWERVATITSEELGGAQVQVEFADRWSAGSVAAHPPRMGPNAVVLTVGSSSGQRVVAYIASEHAVSVEETVTPILEAAVSFAGLVSRRSRLTFERRQGAFLSEFADWLDCTAATTGELPRQALERALTLADADGAVVARENGSPGALRVGSAAGHATAEPDRVLNALAGAVNRAIDAGRAEAFSIVAETRPPRGRGPQHAYGPVLVLPLSPERNVRGAVCFLRSADRDGAPPPPFCVDDPRIRRASADVADCVELVASVHDAERASAVALEHLHQIEAPVARLGADGTIGDANAAAQALLGAVDRQHLIDLNVAGLPLVVQGRKLHDVIDQARRGVPWQGRIHLLRADDLRRCEALVVRTDGTEGDLIMALRDRTQEFKSGRIGRGAVDPLLGAIMHAVERTTLVTKRALTPPVVTGPSPTVRLDTLVREIVDTRARVQQTASLAVQVELPGYPVYVQADPVALQEVVVNLLTNAEDAALEHPRGHVLVGVGKTADAVRVRVADSGPGVPEELRTRVFDPYFTTKDRDRALGLGLALCRRTVEALGGYIAVEDSELGGAAFVVEFNGGALEIQA